MSRGAVVQVVSDLRAVLDEERALAADATTGTLYRLRALHLILAHHLADVYDTSATVQLRPLLLAILEMCLGRSLELKEQLVHLEASEMVYEDSVLQRMKLTHLDLQLRVGRILRRTRDKDRQRFLASVEAHIAAKQTSSTEDEGAVEGQPADIVEDAPLSSQADFAADVVVGVSEAPELGGNNAAVARGSLTPVPQEEDSVVEESESLRRGGGEGKEDAVSERGKDKEIVLGSGSAASGVTKNTTLDVLEAFGNDEKRTTEPNTHDPIKEETMEKSYAQELAGLVEGVETGAVVDVTKGSPKQGGREGVEELLRLEQRDAVMLDETIAFPEETWDMSVREAIILIQSHERARQARYAVQRATAKGAINELNKFRMEHPDIVHKTTVAIQAVWRGYVARRKMAARQIRLGLAVEFYMPQRIWERKQKKLKELQRRSHELQEQLQSEYAEAKCKARERFVYMRAMHEMDEMTDEVRDWFISWYRQAGIFPDYPQGGSYQVSAGLAKVPGEADEGEELKKESQKTTESYKPEKESPSEATGMKPATFLSEMSVLVEEYEHKWEGVGFQKLRNDLLFRSVRQEVRTELRAEVDRLMRRELQVLKAALQRDRAKAGIKTADKPKKAIAGKKRPRPRAVKDLTEGVPAEELYSRLLALGVVRDYPDTDLSAFVGEASLTASGLRRRGQDPLPAPGDVVQALVDAVVLPLSSERVRRLAPLTRSVCLVGPRGCGKTLLVHAICSEVGATLLDLSAENLHHVGEGTDDLAMLEHLVEKVSRLVQPSVVLVENTERLFYRRVPVEEASIHPTRLRAVLPRLAKSISRDDRVVLIGTTSQPWAAQTGPLVKLYQRFVLVPPPNYATAFMFWQKILMRYPGVPRDFDMSSIARSTQGYSIGSIRQAVESVLTPGRVLELPLRPLEQGELLEAMRGQECADAARLLEWYCANTPLCKARTAREAAGPPARR